MSTNKKPEKVVKSKIPTKAYKLIKDVSISGKIVKAGKSVNLTDDGATDFRRKHRIE